MPAGLRRWHCHVYCRLQIGFLLLLMLLTPRCESADPVIFTATCPSGVNGPLVANGTDVLVDACTVSSQTVLIVDLPTLVSNAASLGRNVVTVNITNAVFNAGSAIWIYTAASAVLASSVDLIVRIENNTFFNAIVGFQLLDPTSLVSVAGLPFRSVAVNISGNTFRATNLQNPTTVISVFPMGFLGQGAGVSGSVLSPLFLGSLTLSTTSSIVTITQNTFNHSYFAGTVQLSGINFIGNVAVGAGAQLVVDSNTIIVSNIFGGLVNGITFEQQKNFTVAAGTVSLSKNSMFLRGSEIAGLKLAKNFSFLNALVSATQNNISATVVNSGTFVGLSFGSENYAFTRGSLILSGETCLFALVSNYIAVAGVSPASVRYIAFLKVDLTIQNYAILRIYDGQFLGGDIRSVGGAATTLAAVTATTSVIVVRGNSKLYLASFKLFHNISYGYFYGMMISQSTTVLADDYGSVIIEDIDHRPTGILLNSGYPSPTVYAVAFIQSSAISLSGYSTLQFRFFNFQLTSTSAPPLNSYGDFYGLQSPINILSGGRLVLEGFSFLGNILGEYSGTTMQQCSTLVRGAYSGFFIRSFTVNAAAQGGLTFLVTPSLYGTPMTLDGGAEMTVANVTMNFLDASPPMSIGDTLFLVRVSPTFYIGNGSKFSIVDITATLSNAYAVIGLSIEAGSPINVGNGSSIVLDNWRWTVGQTGAGSLLVVAVTQRALTISSQSSLLMTRMDVAIGGMANGSPSLLLSAGSSYLWSGHASAMVVTGNSNVLINSCRYTAATTASHGLAFANIPGDGFQVTGHSSFTISNISLFLTSSSASSVALVSWSNTLTIAIDQNSLFLLKDWTVRQTAGGQAYGFIHSTPFTVGLGSSYIVQGFDVKFDATEMYFDNFYGTGTSYFGTQGGQVVFQDNKIFLGGGPVFRNSTAAAVWASWSGCLTLLTGAQYTVRGNTVSIIADTSQLWISQVSSVSLQSNAIVGFYGNSFFALSPRASVGGGLAVVLGLWGAVQLYTGSIFEVKGNFFNASVAGPSAASPVVLQFKSIITLSSAIVAIRNNTLIVDGSELVFGFPVVDFSQAISLTASTLDVSFNDATLEASPQALSSIATPMIQFSSVTGTVSCKMAFISNVARTPQSSLILMSSSAAWTMSDGSVLILSNRHFSGMATLRSSILATGTATVSFINSTSPSLATIGCNYHNDNLVDKTNFPSLPTWTQEFTSCISPAYACCNFSACTSRLFTRVEECAPYPGPNTPSLPLETTAVPTMPSTPIPTPTPPLSTTAVPTVPSTSIPTPTPPVVSTTVPAVTISTPAPSTSVNSTETPTIATTVAPPVFPTCPPSLSLADLPAPRLAARDFRSGISVNVSLDLSFLQSRFLPQTELINAGYLSPAFAGFGAWTVAGFLYNVTVQPLSSANPANDLLDPILALKNRLHWASRNGNVTFIQLNASRALFTLQFPTTPWPTIEIPVDTTLLVEMDSRFFRNSSCYGTGSVTVAKVDITGELTSVIQGTRTAVTVSTVAAVTTTLAGGGAIMDAQALALIGMMSCSAPLEQQVLKNPQLLSFFAPNDAWASIIGGNIIFLLLILLLQSIIISIKHWKARDSWQTARAGAKFPGYTFMTLRVGYQGTGLAMIKIFSNAMAEGGGSIFMGVIGLLMVLVTFFGTLVIVRLFVTSAYAEFNYPAYKNGKLNKWYIKLFLPFGMWGPLKVSNAYGDMYANIRREGLAWCVYTLLSPTALVVLSAISPTDREGCIVQYVVMALVPIINLGANCVLRPFTTVMEHLLSAISQLSIATILFGNAISHGRPDVATYADSIILRAVAVQAGVTIFRVIWIFINIPLNRKLVWNLPKGPVLLRRRRWLRSARRSQTSSETKEDEDVIELAEEFVGDPSNAMEDDDGLEDEDDEHPMETNMFFASQASKKKGVPGEDGVGAEGDDVSEESNQAAPSSGSSEPSSDSNKQRSPQVSPVPPAPSEPDRGLATVFSKGKTKKLSPTFAFDEELLQYASAQAEPDRKSAPFFKEESRPAPSGLSAASTSPPMVVPENSPRALQGPPPAGNQVSGIDPDTI